MLAWILLATEWHWTSLNLVIFLLVPFVLLICQLTKRSRQIDHIHSYGGSRVEFPPGSRGFFPFLGETLQFIAAIRSKEGFYSFVRVRNLWYGNCFKSYIFGETHVFVSSIESAKEILSNDLGKFTKRYIRSIGEVVGAESLLCASHLSHKLLRRQLLDLFSSSSIAAFTTQFDQLVVNTIARWEQKGRVIILDEALQITFRAMCKMLFSIEEGCELDVLQKDVTCVCRAMLAFPLTFPWTRFSKGLKARNRIMDMMQNIIQERRGGGQCHLRDHKDFLQYLLVLDTDNEPCPSERVSTLTDAQIKDNILTMIIAGQDTTASAITWMVKYLDENQGVLEAIQDEVQAIEKKLGKSFLSLKELNEMTYGAKVVKETLRMASIVPWFPRVALHDCEIQGHKIKKGWNINVTARSIHLDPTIYGDPYKFNPSRFDEEAKPYSFLAFGAGGRACLGMNLARAMMLVFLYRLVTTYKWKVTDPDTAVEKWALFSRLKSGCPVEVTFIYK